MAFIIFQVERPFGSGEEVKKMDFLDGGHGAKFHVNWPFGSGKEAKTRFSR